MTGIAAAFTGAEKEKQNGTSSIRAAQIAVVDNRKYEKIFRRKIGGGDGDDECSESSAAFADENTRA